MSRDRSLQELVRNRLRQFLEHAKDYELQDLYGIIIAEVERPLIELVLEKSGGNQLRAARILGINRNTLRKKIGTLGLDRKERRGSRPR